MCFASLSWGKLDLVGVGTSARVSGLGEVLLVLTYIFYLIYAFLFGLSETQRNNSRIAIAHFLNKCKCVYK